MHLFANSTGLQTLRDVFMVVGIVLPILASILFYLIKRNMQETQAHRKTETDGIRNEIGAVRSDMVDLKRKIETIVDLHANHKNECMERFISQRQHESELRLIRDQISGVVSKTSDANDVMDKVFRLADQISRRASPLGGEDGHTR